MILDRNFGTGKYAIIKMRAVHALDGLSRASVDRMMLRLAELGVLESPRPGDPGEFFVIRLQDKYAPLALDAYAAAAAADDPEYAAEVSELAERAQVMPGRKVPD